MLTDLSFPPPRRGYKRGYPWLGEARRAQYCAWRLRPYLAFLLLPYFSTLPSTVKILLCINEFKISSLAETLAVLVVFVEKVSVEIELHIAFLGGHVVQSLGRIESIEPAGRQHSITHTVQDFLRTLESFPMHYVHLSLSMAVGNATKSISELRSMFVCLPFYYIPTDIFTL